VIIRLLRSCRSAGYTQRMSMTTPDLPEPHPDVQAPDLEPVAEEPRENDVNSDVPDVGHDAEPPD
jgi:hypothetical protein